jgi:hypothetical protein
VSQQAVERTIGKLITDEAFRARFFDDPEAATWEAGLVLTSGELDALSRLSRVALVRFSERIGARLRRCWVSSPERIGS